MDNIMHSIDHSLSCLLLSSPLSLLSGLYCHFKVSLISIHFFIDILIVNDLTDALIMGVAGFEPIL